MKTIFPLLAVALVCIPVCASADEGNKLARFGFGADLGVPSGIAVGAVVCDNLCALRAEVSLTHNVLSFGGRLSLKVDPLALKPNVPIGLFIDVQGGIAGQGNIPKHADLPPIGYDYINFYGGLRLGKARNFHWNIEVGPTYLVASTKNFQSYVSKNGSNDVRVSDPSVKAWLVPTFATGFEVVW